MSAFGANASAPPRPFFRSFDATSVAFQTCARRIAARRAFGDILENEDLSAAPGSANCKMKSAATAARQADNDCLRTQPVEQEAHQRRLAISVEFDFAYNPT